MTRPNHVHTKTLLAIAAMLIVGLGASAFAADPPVVVTVAVTGDAVPGATVTAKATVKINDGSAFQSISWAQYRGADATLANTNTDTVTVVLPNRKAFKDETILVLEEPPTTNLPAHIPVPEPYTGGLQNRYTVVAVAPLAHEEGASIGVEITVVTSSGTYKSNASIPVTVDWGWATGNRNIAIGLPVLLHGKDQASYDWTLAVPTGSKAALVDPTSQNPDFTPDIAGTYKVTVTDIASKNAVTFDVHAGTWKGVITGQDSNGRPVADAACVSCHVPNTPNFDMFTPWAKSGHAEIFTQNVEVAGHYSTACLACHSVGYNTAVNNNGIDDQPDWQAFSASGLLEHGATGNWGKILTQFPKTARLANIQCENCHGPQDSAAHMKNDGSRQTLSSDLCGSCHGEPARHGRFQQWQLSGHANMALAESRGTNASCAKCHSAQGFLQWQDKGFSTPVTITVDWTTDNVQPQSCAVCHDTHNVGNVTGEATDAHLRVEGDTPMLDAGFKATNVGKGALCITCHNGRRGLMDDAQTWDPTQATRAPHVGPQGDMIMGQNLYFTKVGQRGFHAMIQDACVTCHMVKTDPPADLSYQLGGTNHTFFASKTICSQCHTEITAESVQEKVEAKLETLKAEIESAIKYAMQAQIRGGNQMDLNGTKVKNVSDIVDVELIESHGAQGVTVTLANGSKVADISLATVKVVRPGGTSVGLYTIVNPALPKAGWNYFSVESDASKGVHNPAFINSGLDVAIYAVKTMNAAAATPAPPVPAAGLGGGLGNGAGAITCTTPYVYWAEIVAHSPGAAESQWRTDIIARNLTTNPASLRFVLHQAGGNLEGTGTVNASSQKAFEDIVATLGGMNNKGSLEICSDQPLLVSGRIFNQDATGTFGQGFDGHVADLGYTVGQTISLIGLRQKADAYRTNISVTNAGTTEAQVSVTLYDSTGTALNTYTLTIPAGLAAQDTEPFVGRANAPNVDWGFATVTVLKGSNIRASASMIDMKTNDPTTIEAKQ